MLGHRPKCAQNAAERYAEFPKLRRIDSLRPYLIKYDLFPPRRDPETAPIRIEELKELVRKWNLHQERNFWRHNTTKDDIVRVLYNYKLKLEMGQGMHVKSRRASMLGQGPGGGSGGGAGGGSGGGIGPGSPGPISGAASPGAGGPGGARKSNKPRGWVYGELSDEDHQCNLLDALKSLPMIRSVLTFNMAPPNAVLASWKRRDFFKNNFAFICLCRSVAPDGHGYLRPHQLDQENRLRGEALKKAEAAAAPNGAGGPSSGAGRHSVDGEDNTSVHSSNSSLQFSVDSGGAPQQQQPQVLGMQDPNAKVKLTCSVALLNISLRIDAEDIFLEQNGLQDLLNLMASTSEAEVLLNCSACLVNVTRNSEGGIQMMSLMQSDIVPNLVRVARFDSEYLRQTSALALCQLTSHDGGELWLIQEGAVQGLNNLLHAHNNYTRLIAVKGLINLLTFVSAPRAETITAAIMKIIYNMATIPDEEVQNICAEALEVLSSFSGVRHLITEAGGVSILSFLMHSGHLAEHAMATCALAIANMSQIKKSRKDMVSMGICSVLISILKIGDRSTKVTCAQALWQLSREQELRESLIHDKVLPMLADLLMSENDDELSTLAALNLANFCADQSCQPLVMKEGAGKALVAVLRKGGLDVQRVALQAIVHLVVSASAFDALMSYGLVEAMDNLVQSKSHDVALAVAYLSLSTYEGARERLAQKGVVPSLLTLFASEDPTVKTFCLAALQNVSTNDKTLPSFKGMGMVQALSETLSIKGLDPRAFQYCSAILVNLSAHEGLSKDIYEDGGVLFLVSLAKRGNDQTKYYCAATLYNLSLRHVLTREAGFITGLVDLTSNHYSARQLLCSKIFANASMNSKGRTAIGSNLSVLVCLCRMLRSTCENCDKIQYYAALAVCNSLSIYFKRGDIEDMVRVNFVNDLAVIMMLRVNEVSTKTILAKALFNLLVREDTREMVDNQDVTQSLLRLMKLQVPELSQICILAVANLSRELDRFGVKLGKIRAVGILLAEGTNRLIGPEVKSLCAHALANLSFEPSCRRAMVREELVMGMRSITATVDGRALEDSAALFFNLAQDHNCHEGLIEKKAIKLIVHTAHSTNLAVVQELCLAALCTLSTTSGSHVQLVHDAMPFISHALHTNATPRVARLDAARLLCNLVTYHDPARKAAVDAKCIAALADLTKTLQEEEDIAMVGKILREISNSEEALPGMLQDGVMNILFKLAKMDPGSIKLDAAHALANLSFCKFRSAMVETGLVETLFWLTLEDCLQYNTPIFQRVSVALRNAMLVVEGVRSRTIMEDKFIETLIKVSQYPEDNVQLNAAVALYHVASHKRTQTLVVKKGVLLALIDLADLGHPLIRQICSAAMHTLPPEATENCNDKRLIKILMTMLHADANKLAIIEALADRPKSKVDLDWEPTEGQYKYHRKEVKPSWQNHMVDTDLFSRPFAPVHVALEKPQANTDGLVNSLHNVKSTMGEFHKLPLKVEKKLTPLDLGSELHGAHLVPTKLRNLSAGAPQQGSSGGSGFRGAVSFDSAGNATNNSSNNNGSGSLDEAAININIGNNHEDAMLNNNNNNHHSSSGGEAAITGGATGAGGMVVLPTVASPGHSGGHSNKVMGGGAGVHRGAPAGHGIIAARDRAHHDKFVEQLGLPQVVSHQVQQTSVAGSFAGKRGLQRPAITVLRASPPSSSNNHHQPLSFSRHGGGRGDDSESPLRPHRRQQHSPPKPSSANSNKAAAVTPRVGVKTTQEQRILNNYVLLETADGVEDHAQPQAQPHHER